MELPAFLFGDEQSVVDVAEATGIAWANAFRSTRMFAPSDLRVVSPDQVVVVHDGTLDPHTPRWRLFGAAFAIVAGELVLDAPEREAFVAASRATPWGALATCIRHRPPNTAEVVAARGRAVLGAWPSLATLHYAGAAKRMPSIILYPEPDTPSIGLDALVGQLFSGPLALWGPQLGSSRKRLEHALEAMAAASLDEARGRLLAHMVMLARNNRRTKGTHAEDPARIAAALAALSDPELAALVPGITSDLLPILYGLAADGAGRERAGRSDLV